MAHEQKGDLPLALASFQKELTALKAVVTSSVALGGKIMHLAISWDANAKKTGRFPIGTMQVSVPGEAVLGSTFLLGGSGSAQLQTFGSIVEKPMQVIAPLIRIWGGPQPATLTITGPDEVVEGSEIELTVVAEGIPVQEAKAGWWMNPMTGKVTVIQSWPGALTARIKGRNAGYVKISAVVGTKVCEKIIRVKPYVPLIFQRA